MIIAMIYPPFLELSDALVGMLILAIYTFVEPVMLSTVGTTPLKALLNVRVRDANGKRLSFPKALARTVKIWIIGLGLGIPLISLFTHLSAYSRLKNQGITSWDADGGFTVSHRDVAWWRWLIMILFIFGFIALVTLGIEEGG